MRSRTLVLAITTALLVGAGPAQAHGGHHHKRHKPRAVDVQLLGINDFHGNLAPPGTITLPGGVRTPAGGAEYLAILQCHDGMTGRRLNPDRPGLV